jgi:thiopeptide-type bacteriocin biosynthesis protein
MSDFLCLYTLLHAPREHHEEILRDFATPVARLVRDRPELHSLFFARYSIPEWQLRFRILGEPAWVDGTVREIVEEHLAPLRQAPWLAGVEFATYDREVERYGGAEGMALAEKLFLYDSLACLDLIDAERRGALAKSRRELSLLLTDRLLDLLEMDRESRIGLYEFGYRWAIEQGTWDEADLRVLEERYQTLRPGLLALFEGEQSRDPELLWGGSEPAAIAERWLAASRPVAQQILAAHRAGRIHQELPYLAWSYSHMQANRLGIDTTPEAILRFFMHRLLRDEAAATAAPAG